MEFAMGWNKFNLKVLGVWPETAKLSRATRCFSNLVFWSSTSITFAFICLPQTVHLILESANLNEIVENLSINVPVVFAWIKQLVLRYHGKALTLLVSQILDDWVQPVAEPERRLMLRNARLSRAISLVCSVLTYLMVGSFLVLQIWMNTNNLGGLLHPATFPYDTQKSPNYQITWLGQLIGTIVTAIGYSCFDTFLAVLVLHLCGQLTVLNTRLRNLVDVTQRDDFSGYQEKLRFIVHKHEELYRFSILVENCFNLTLLGQTIISTFMFCMTGYRIIVSMNQDKTELPIIAMIFFIVHVVYTMFHIFIYCYIGEQLLIESTGLAQSAYDCEWYDLPSKKAVCLILIIVRANVSFKLTAGKFTSFSFELFSAILRTSAGYLSVLLAMNDRLSEEQ